MCFDPVYDQYGPRSNWICVSLHNIVDLLYVVTSVGFAPFHHIAGLLKVLQGVVK